MPAHIDRQSNGILSSWDSYHESWDMTHWSYHGGSPSTRLSEVIRAEGKGFPAEFRCAPAGGISGRCTAVFRWRSRVESLQESAPGATV